MEEWAAVLRELRIRKALVNLPAGRRGDRHCLTLLLLSS